MIYLHKKYEIIYKIVIFILLLVFIYSVGYISSYLKYDDKKIIEYETLLLQNKNLREEFDEIKNLNLEVESYVIGKVIIRNIHSFYDEIVINVGNDKVSVGDAVVNNEGLVGVVYKTDKFLSYVKLLSSDYNVSVMIGDTYGNLKNGKITLLDKYSDIKEGDFVYTSGLSNVPKGIYIGRINKVQMDNEKLGKEVNIQIIDNNNLNYVGVISNIK